MAIAFARSEFVKRSEGKTACHKSAYNSRGRIHFQGNPVVSQQVYDWRYKGAPAFHEIYLPKGVDTRFKDPEVLWNHAEECENRVNSQVAFEIVLALPDDEVISLEDRIEISKSFLLKHIVDKGLAAQLDIHKPEKVKVKGQEKDGEEGGGDHNWHAHCLITTRRFDSEGKSLDEKARDLMPDVKKGKVISGQHWGKLWAEHQNNYFEEKGLDLRVDPTGAVPQIHLGPVRMRGPAHSLTEENETLKELNSLSCRDPVQILKILTENTSVFNSKDVERFLLKHVESELISEVRDGFWNNPDLTELYDKKTGLPSGNFTSNEVLEEERKIFRICERLNRGSASQVSYSDEDTQRLNKEQAQAYQAIVKGKKLTLLEGHAGTGKSHLMAALKETYRKEGFSIKAFGPDNVTADVLKEKGFESSENIHRFLFSLNNGHREVRSSKEVWFVDEASKIGNQPLLELLKVAEKNKVHLILAGNSSQLPSVQRGGMFKVLCERFGCLQLDNIQRQKFESDRLISRKLALGRIGEAIDLISSNGGFKWASTREEAAENLVKSWAIDKGHFPNSNTIMIAHSNREVSLLNELAHHYRHQRGEIDEKEYLCHTEYGTVTVSVGDLLEFRKNDKELSVFNGSTGVLKSASESKFTVEVKDRGEAREVSFDPNTYSFFKLGYASTFYRSQGQTVDRAYILHSTGMNKEMFYVGLTRHIKKAFCFISRCDVRGLAHLKNQMLATSYKETTYNYQTFKDIHESQVSTEKLKALENLKNGGALDRIKGTIKENWDQVVNVTNNFIYKIKDRRIDPDFYNPVIPEKRVKGFVKELEKDGEKNALKDNINTIIRHSNQSENDKEKMSLHKPNKEMWSNFKEEQKTVLRDYFKHSSETSVLYAAVKAECEHSNKAQRETTAYSNWIQACGLRNQTAHKVTTSIPPDQLKSYLNKSGFEILMDRSNKHASLYEEKGLTKKEIEHKLGENIESLLYELFPEGPTFRDRNGFRFGSKGSLSVVCQGEKLGSFYDFKEGESGGLIKLVGKVRGMDYKAAKEWSLDFLGKPRQDIIPTHFNFQKLKNQPDKDWISLLPTTEAPQLKDLSPKLNEIYEEKARYTYRDQSGSVLFHTLRLVERENPSKKIVLPLSFGHHTGEGEEPAWALKGYKSSDKPLYGLDILDKYKSETVLIVEGEKTADAANELLKKSGIVAISWSGGASATHKSNWIPLFNREVVIWPDNDEAGFKAAQEISQELRRIGVKSLKICDQGLLKSNLPEKWDLADSLPSSLTYSFIKDTIQNAPHKAIGSNRIRGEFLINPASSRNWLEYLKMNAVTSSVDERLREGLEKEHGSRHWEIEPKILDEVHKVLGSSKILEEKIDRFIGAQIDSKELFLTHLFCKSAKDGQIPSDDYVSSLKELLHKGIRPNGESAVNNWTLIKSLNEQFLSLKDRDQIQKSMKNVFMAIRDLPDYISKSDQSKEAFVSKDHHIFI